VTDFGVYSGWRMKLPFDSGMRFPLILHSKLAITAQDCLSLGALSH
jgi:hypothetical protein